MHVVCIAIAIVCMYVRTYVCMYVHMQYVCIHVCMTINRDQVDYICS